MPEGARLRSNELAIRGRIARCSDIQLTVFGYFAMILTY